MTRVMLAGGGHTHLIAGPALARRAGDRARIVLLASSPRLLYSGMMPGWLSGQYRFDDCAIDLGRVARAAGIDWIEDTLVDVNFRAREVVGASGRRHAYDLLSLNVGSSNPVGEVAAGATVRVLGAKPFAEFVAGWDAWLATRPPRPRCIVAGGGAAAVEIACALAAGCRADGPLAGGSVALVASGDALLGGMSRAAAALALRSLRRLGVEVHLRRRYLGVAGGQLRVAVESGTGDDEGERRLDADLAIVATGAQPPGWLRDAARRDGVPVAADGGIAVDDCMRSTGDPAVFASGDCASFVGAHVPKSGVHALRQGGPLAESIAASLDGRRPRCGPPAAYRPQRRALALLNRCDGSAIAAWGPLGAAGAVWWRWKDRIDRRFVDRFR